MSTFFPVAILLLTASAVGFAPPEGADAVVPSLVEKLKQEGLGKQQALALLQRIVAGGPRLAGSPGAANAVAVTQQIMVEMGLDNVHLEAVEVKHWVRGSESASIVGGEKLSVMALGGSVGTPEGGVAGEVIEVLSLEECDALGDRAKGRIIFFNRPMDPTHYDTFNAYGGAADQRVHAASRAAAVGAVAVLVRSMTMRHDDVPHTGVMKYADDVPKIPAAGLSLIAADALHDALAAQQPVRVKLILGCQMLDPVISHNVVGDITGSELPNEIVLLGGHLDSWDAGDGAHDDGSGCAQTLEAMRLIQSLGVRPRRTIRAVMFMDEEFGGTGGKAYAIAPERQTETHLAAIESDRGGFLPLGFTVKADAEKVKSLQVWLPLIAPLGMTFIKEGYGGVDINPLAELGTLTIGLYPDSQRYFDYHHSANDVFAAVNPRHLELGAIAMAVLASELVANGVPPKK